MTEKDYIEFADIMHDSFDGVFEGSETHSRLSYMRDRIVEYFESEDMNFNKDKFMAACNKE